MTKTNTKARRPKKGFFLPTLCRANNDPPATKIEYGRLLECRSTLDRESDKSTFLAMFEQNIGQKLGKSSPANRIPYRNRSGVVQLVGRDRLLFAKF